MLFFIICVALILYVAWETFWQREYEKEEKENKLYDEKN